MVCGSSIPFALKVFTLCVCHQLAPDSAVGWFITVSCFTMSMRIHSSLEFTYVCYYLGVYGVQLEFIAVISRDLHIIHVLHVVNNTWSTPDGLSDSVHKPSCHDFDHHIYLTWSLLTYLCGQCK